MQTADVQFLSGKKNVSPNPDVEKTVNVNENLKSNKKSFKSILESVKSEKTEDARNRPSDSRGVRADEKSPRAEEKETVKQNPSEQEKTVAQKGGAEKTDETKKDTAAKKNQRKPETDTTDEVESNEIVVELDLEELVSDENALAESLSSASALVLQDADAAVENVDIDAPVDFDIDIDASEAVVAVPSFADGNYAAPEDVSAEDISLTGLPSEDFEDIALVSDEKIPEPVDSLVQSEIAEELSTINLTQTTDSVDPDSDVVADVKAGSQSSTPVDEKKPVFTVVDQRTESVASEKVSTADEGNASDNSLGAGLDSANVFSAQETVVQGQTVQNSGETFTQMLSQQIQNGAPEFVKAGNIILKDNNTGSITMVLKPENLGNVKVSLELSDKILSGQIVVQSKEAYEAFKQNMDTLRQAFQNNGFENAELNLVLAQNADSSGTFAQGQQQSGEQYMANRTYSDFAQPGESSELSAGSEMYTKVGDHQIDVVA